MARARSPVAERISLRSSASRYSIRLGGFRWWAWCWGVLCCKSVACDDGGMCADELQFDSVLVDGEVVQVCFGGGGEGSEG